MKNFFKGILIMLALVCGLNKNNFAQCDINLGCIDNITLNIDPPVFNANSLSITFGNVEIGNFSCNEANYIAGMAFYLYQLLPDGSRITQCTVVSEPPLNIVANIGLNFGQSNFCETILPIGDIDAPPSEGFEACDGALLEAEAVLYITEQTNIDIVNESIYTLLPTNQYLVVNLGTIEININDEFPGNGQPLTTAELRDFSSQTDGPQTLTCGQNIELYTEGLSRLANCAPYNDVSTGIPSESFNEFYYQINGGQPIIIADENSGAVGGQITGPDSNLSGNCFAGLLSLNSPYVLNYSDLPQNICNGSEIVFTLKTTDLFTNQTVQDTYTVTYSNGNGDCIQSINLNSGWNLISLDVTPANNNFTSIFDDIIGSGNLQYVTGFDNGAKVFNPNGPPFLNTINELSDGFGYWVKVTNADVLNVEGACLDDGFRKPFDAGWNLVAYPPDAQQMPATYFDDIIGSGNLQYVTGFDNGANVFNPNGPPFLNTLLQMKNGYGYWVKVTTPSAKQVNNLTNVFSFINGTSNLPYGEQVKVLNEQGETIAVLDVIEDSYLMTAPIYGDDLTTDYKENISIDEKLQFSWNNQISDFTTNFKGDYAIEIIDLKFKLDNSLNSFNVKAYPIPAKDVLNFEIAVKESTDLLIQVYDNKGSLIQSIDKTSLTAGTQIISYNVSNLSAGIYTYQLITGEQISAGKFNVVR